jgi:hypothetical protein
MMKGGRAEIEVLDPLREAWFGLRKPAASDTTNTSKEHRKSFMVVAGDTGSGLILYS